MRRFAERIGFGAMTAAPEPTLGVDASILSGSCSASDGVAAQLINYRESQIFMSWVDWLTWACCNRKGPLSRVKWPACPRVSNLLLYAPADWTSVPVLSALICTQARGAWFVWSIGG